jgi:hypothetical protein
MATRAKTAFHDENQFAIHRQTRHEKITSKGAGRNRRGHFPLWLDAIFIIIVVGAAAAVGFVLTHPSPHRSAEAIATNFVQQVGAGNYEIASKDVDPAEQATALKTLASQSGVPGGVYAAVHTTQFGSESGSGTSETVVIKACNSSLACNPLPAIPCEEIHGQWYVDWGLLLQTLVTN